MIKKQMATFAQAIHPRLGSLSPARLLQTGGSLLLPMIATFVFEDAPTALTQKASGYLFEPIVSYGFYCGDPLI